MNWGLYRQYGEVRVDLSETWDPNTAAHEVGALGHDAEMQKEQFCLLFTYRSRYF